MPALPQMLPPLAALSAWRIWRISDHAFSDYILLTLALGVLIFLRNRWGSGSQAGLRVLAERLGFTVKVNSGGWFTKLEGTHRGRAMQFYTFQYLGSMHRSWIAVEAALRLPAEAELRVRPNDWRIRWGRKRVFSSTQANGQTITNDRDAHGEAPEELRTGDESFDAAFLVDTTRPEWARAILTPGVRDALLAARPQVGPLVNLSVNEDEVCYSVPGNFNRPDRIDHLVAQMDFVCSLAEQIEASTPRQRAFTANPI
jgi:hypothetical protein